MGPGAQEKQRSSQPVSCSRKQGMYVLHLPEEKMSSRTHADPLRFPAREP